ncbi:HORMA domain-containing protein 1 isoform X4 [Hemicordylus capensis]|uniref:HORMA domain-containing protein 1 isoform X4 n=1 Tax=Hemicordylus capensis TaxID=884348 RepID=UPI002303D8FA|nr:HORMA domain-containing protein 1 isoform X4 [Hemicordylus capensis]
MATAQKQRNSLSAAIFPNKIATEQQSLVLVKRMLAVAVSCITYLRGIFPEDAYGTRYLDDLCVKILREDKNCPGSSQLVKWMLGCYDALQKKYLRLIVLAVYTNQENPQTVTECYQFKFKYTDQGAAMDFTSKNQGKSSNITCADTKKASILLIRKIYVLMQNLGPLPDDICLTMKLFYYDEELNLTCEEDENMRTEGSQALSINNSQVEHLVNETSKLEVSEGKTRSGKRFQRSTGGAENRKQQVGAKCPKEHQKRSSSESGKPVYHFEFSSSQDSGPKRRKFSEPKEQF